MSELKAKGITKKYGTKEVLHGIDLTLEKGKIYGLIGRNGAGKTTLLSILTSQNPATEGSVTFDEMQVWENPEALKLSGQQLPFFLIGIRKWRRS